MRRNLLLAGCLGVLVAGAALPSGAAESPSARGAKVYGQFCAGCHGANMVYRTGSFDLRAFPTDQHDRFIRSVMKGKGAMPAWQGAVTPAQAEDLWAYVTAAKVKPAAPKGK